MLGYIRPTSVPRIEWKKWTPLYLAQTANKNSVHTRQNAIDTMALSKECRPNGVPKTSKVPRSEAGFRPASGYVAAIDFGTTYCSVAYTLQGSEDILKLPLDGPHTRVPNAILIERENNTVAAFGYHAQDKFSQLKKQQWRYIYFERMKMILYRRRVSQFLRYQIR